MRGGKLKILFLKNEFLTMFWILSSCLQLQSMIVRASVNISFSHLDCFILLKINYRLFFEKFGFSEFCLDNFIFLVLLIWKSAFACSFTNCLCHSVRPAAFWLCRWLSDIRISWRIKFKVCDWASGRAGRCEHFVPQQALCSAIPSSSPNSELFI